LVDDFFVSHLTVDISGGVEDCGPEKLFELDVFVVGGEDIFFLAWLDVVTLLEAVELVDCGVMH
jgi:hypothetical protein